MEEKTLPRAEGRGGSAPQPWRGMPGGGCLEQACVGEKLAGVCSYPEKRLPRAFLPDVDKEKIP